MGQAFVLAQTHADGAGQIAQGFAATNPSSAVAQSEKSGGRVVNLHINTAFEGFFDQDSGIGVEPDFRPGAEKQRLVDAIFALDGKGRQGTKAQFAVEAFRLGVVVQHGQVEVAQAAAHEVFDQMPDQHFAYTGPRAVGVHCQAPEAAAFFRVVERGVMVQAHDAADHRAAVFILGHPVHRPALIPGGEQCRVDGQHRARLIQRVD